MKVSLITTVLNEENSIKKFLDSVVKQTKLPEELVIVDGGSTDSTESVISNFQFPLRLRSRRAISNLRFKFFKKKGNRSVGRNLAIKNSTGDIIAVSDAGCILDKNWLKNITAPFVSKEVDVVAGYYDARVSSPFQKALAPYVLVMPDKINPKTFLPATRSMAFRKSIWEKVGGFPEKYSHNEDYVFARRLKKKNASIVFVRNAVVHWIPRRTLVSAFSMFYRFAKGDTEAGILRPKVVVIYVRYVVGAAWGVWIFWERNTSASLGLFVLVILYVGWAVWKNYKYINHPMAFFYLPLLQITSDIAIILGTSYGLLKRLMVK